MEVQTEQNLEVTPSSEPAPEGASAPPAAPTPGTEPPKSVAELVAQKQHAKSSVTAPMEKAPATPATPPFQPNFKFKAADKFHEIPELLRSVIKDPESQKFVHQLFEKAYGLDVVKEKLQGIRSEHQELQSAYTNVMQPVQMAREAYQRGDLDTVFKTFRISEEKVLQWAVNKVKLSQMPPDQRQVHEAREAAERRNWELERTQAELSQEQLQAQTDQLHQMVDLVLERQDYSAIAQAFDERRGKPGAFRELVFQQGAMEYHTSGKVLSPIDAVKRAVDLVGPAPTAAPQQAAAPVATAPAPAPQATPPKVVLPHVGGTKAAAPAKQPVKSLDDIRRIRDQMLGT